VLFASVDPAAKNIVVVTADTLGITLGRAVELILLSLPLDSDGLPSIIDREAFGRQEELPIPAA
jgi:hypothetical protein